MTDALLHQPPFKLSGWYWRLVNTDRRHSHYCSPLGSLEPICLNDPDLRAIQRLILAILVFLLPMVVVGAIKAKGNNRNDVKGWLPLEYPETKTYRFFRENFQGEEFILVSWDGCTMDDPRLELLARKLLPPPEEASRISRTIFFKTAQTGPRAVEQMTEEPLNLDPEEL